jgi:hypothetical protein
MPMTQLIAQVTALSNSIHQQYTTKGKGNGFKLQNEKRSTALDEIVDDIKHTTAQLPKALNSNQR